MTYIEELAKALHHEDPEVRVRVANALKELKDPRATTPLIEALDDECQEVRRAVAWALQNCADERALPTFIQMLRDRNDSVRLWAAFGLQRVGDETAVEALIESLEDPYDSVREQAVIALAKIGDRRAVNPLIRALEDPDCNVRMEAEFYLREAFKVRYNPETQRTETINEKNTFDVKSLSPEERAEFQTQLQTVLEKIRSLEEETEVCRDSMLWDELYWEHDIKRRRVAELVSLLVSEGLINSPRPGYYNTSRTIAQI